MSADDNGDESERRSLDLTGEVDRNWLNADPPEPAYLTATEEERAAAWEHYERRQQASKSQASTIAKSAYERVDDALYDAYRKSVWWELDAEPDHLDLQKAPRIWTTDDQVPEYVQEVIADVIENTDWDWADFESLSADDAQRLVELLDEKLTQPQGWSVGSLAEDIEDEFGLSQEAALGVARDTSHNVLNTAREEAYEQMEGSEQFEYDWINPMDHRTTEVCKGIVSDVEAKGGSVTLPTLKSILRKWAQKYEGTAEGGTPRRVDNWEPHYQCRSTFVRRVRSGPLAA